MKNNWPQKATIGDVELTFDCENRGGCGEIRAYYKTIGGARLLIEKIYQYGSEEPEYHLRTPIQRSPYACLRDVTFRVIQGDGDGI